MATLNTITPFDGGNTGTLTTQNNKFTFDDTAVSRNGYNIRTSSDGNYIFVGNASGSSSQILSLYVLIKNGNTYDVENLDSATEPTVYLNNGESRFFQCSPDGRKIYTAATIGFAYYLYEWETSDGTWKPDTITRTLIKTWNPGVSNTDNYAISIDISEDGLTLVTGNNRTTNEHHSYFRWNGSTWDEYTAGNVSDIQSSCVGISPSGNIVITSGMNSSNQVEYSIFDYSSNKDAAQSGSVNTFPLGKTITDIALIDRYTTAHIEVLNDNCAIIGYTYYDNTGTISTNPYYQTMYHGIAAVYTLDNWTTSTVEWLIEPETSDYIIDFEMETSVIGSDNQPYYPAKIFSVSSDKKSLSCIVRKKNPSNDEDALVGYIRTFTLHIDNIFEVLEEKTRKEDSVNLVNSTDTAPYDMFRKSIAHIPGYLLVSPDNAVSSGLVRFIRGGGGENNEPIHLKNNEYIDLINFANDSNLKYKICFSMNFNESTEQHLFGNSIGSFSYRVWITSFSGTTTINANTFANTTLNNNAFSNSQIINNYDGDAFYLFEGSSYNIRYIGREKSSDIPSTNNMKIAYIEIYSGSTLLANIISKNGKLVDTLSKRIIEVSKA